MRDWPSNYNCEGSSANAPALTVQETVRVGIELAKALIKTDPYPGNLKPLSAYYHAVVKQYRHSPDWPSVPSYLQTYKMLIKTACSQVIGSPNIDQMNEHDFANVHRAASLAIMRALCRLVGFSPFYGAEADPHNQWGDPPDGEVTRRVVITTKHGQFFVETPLAIGCYAIANQDFDDFEGQVLNVPKPPKALMAEARSAT